MSNRDGPAGETAVPLKIGGRVMHSQVLVLSADKAQSESWASSLNAWGLRARSCAEWTEAHRLLIAGSCSVVLYDSDARIAPPTDVLATSRSAGLPTIVIARELDAKKWMSLFRSGAFDVLRTSTELRHLCESVEAAMNNSRNRAAMHSSWPKSLFEWTKSKLQRDSSDMVKKAADGSRDPK
jgi:DNA-binding NtrC family response regulator